jgi:transposase InsO family protein
MASIFGLSRSSYYKKSARPLSKREKNDQQIGGRVVQLFTTFREEYGAIRIKRELSKQNITVSKRRVRRIMKQKNLVAKARKKFKVTTTQSTRPYRVADNLLKQNFMVNAPNVAWVSDITYVRTSEGWLYVATVIDLFSRKVVGLAISQRINKDLVLRALSQAVKARKPPHALVVHSDRGSQYTSKAYWKLAEKFKIKLSMSAKGCCYDNAVAESFFHTLKLAVVHGHNYRTRNQATRCIFEYIECFYNTTRAHSTLDYLSPNEFEAKWQPKQTMSIP